MDSTIKSSLKQTGKQVMRSFLFLAIIIFIMYMFRPKWYWLIIGICLFQLVMALFRGEFSWRSVLQGWLLVIVFAALFSFIYSFGWYGFWIDIGLTLAYVMIFKWKDYIKSVEMVETRIYGHPSKWYKENNMKLPKVRFGK